MSKHQRMSRERIERVRRTLIAKYGLSCQLCRRRIALAPSTDPGPWAFTIDHIVELGQGGRDLLDNLQPAHRLCNERKSGHVRAEWVDL